MGPLLLASLLLIGAAPTERYALIVGHNRSLNPDNPPLAYADDDALRAAEVLGTFIPAEHIFLLVEADEDSRRLFGEAASSAPAPTLARLREAVTKLSSQLRGARARGVRTEVFFIYGGHGDVEDGQAFIDLLDGRLSAEDLEREVIAVLPADRLHLIVDSCNSYYLLSPRAPGGQRYTLPPQKTASFFERYPHVGVFLSTSAANEVYEWSQLQSGIFSHEVRSGLLGAADLNNDARITYAELEAFVRVANQDLVNERYRPRIFARAPAVEPDSMLAPAGLSGLRLPHNAGGRFFIEDDRGLRLTEFHKAKGLPLKIALPSGPRRYFLRRIRGRLGGGAGPSVIEELSLKEGPGGVELASTAPQVQPRGAESSVFKALFLSPFTQIAATRAANKAPPAGRASATHGPTLSVSVESGHLAAMRPVTFPALGYRYALDRWSLEARLGFGFALNSTDEALLYDLFRYALVICPRYDLPFGRFALSLGVDLEAALEQQEAERPAVGPGGAPTTEAFVLRAFSGRWAAAAGVLIGLGEAWQVGVELLGGGRLLEIGGAIQHRFTAGARVGFYWIF